MAFTVLSAGLGAASGQTPQSEAPRSMMETLKVLVLEGSNSVNVPSRGLTVVPVVEVRDRNDRPVEGAEVTFRLPATGPGGFFPGQATARTVRTNLQGQAAATDYRANHEMGNFKIQVTAVIGDQMGSAAIEQTNAAAGPVDQAMSSRRGGRLRWWLLGGGAAAAVVAAILLTGDDSPGSGTPITITPGPVTIGR